MTHAADAATARWLLARLGVTVDASPARRTARGRLVVANHLGCLDVLVLAAWRPLVFVAKRDVADWPLIGAWARRRRTIFIDRRPTRALPGTIATITDVLRAGHDVLVFPEATTSTGGGVLPFKPACFEAARMAGADVELVQLDYRFGDGQPAHADAAWVGDGWLLPHLAARCVAPPLIARPLPAGTLRFDARIDRKQLAQLAQARLAAQVARAGRATWANAARPAPATPSSMTALTTMPAIDGLADGSSGARPAAVSPSCSVA